MWSVRSCEGSLKKRGHCLVVNGLDARALIAPVSISGKLSVRRMPPDQLAQQTQPRAVLRVANRGNNRDTQHPTHAHHAAHDLEPFLQDLQNDVARLSRAFATLGLEANALVRSEAEMRARIENHRRVNERTDSADEESPPPTIQNNQVNGNNESAPLSRSARRRMRQRLRAALNETQPPPVQMPPVPAPRAINQFGGPQRQNGPTPPSNTVHRVGFIQVQPPVPAPPVPPPPVPPPSSSGPSNGLPQNGNGRNKKKRRHRR